MILVAALVLASQQPPTSPAGGYWQQHVSYAIDARLDEPSGVLAGRQRLIYVNQSPDTLHTISFHLYLNAFRPGSRWAETDAAERLHRFDRLQDPDYGYNHVRNVQIAGVTSQPVYPFAPDSTIVRFALPAPLPPGVSVPVTMDFDARPSTLPRRQGRQGRRFDFAQWYPRVVVYDRYGWRERPLYPAGEFYGEFGEFTVTLDVPSDQVIGATGVPLCGDPGWARANRRPDHPVEYHRGAYPLAFLAMAPNTCTSSGPGRKTIVWRAEDVHHFAMSMSPDYRYEGGHFGATAVHVLYSPGDERSWGGGVVAGRTETALGWFDELFGPYPWPQMTVVHRIEGGGTEFPMMQMNGSPSQGLILHEGGHNYLMGILANNEWREGWLDEGFTSFQTTWFNEEHGQGGGYRKLEARILGLELDGYAQPVSLPAEDYRDFRTYNQMIYGKGELFLHQLREVVGRETMRRILRTYYARWKLRHVDEAAFQAVAEEVSHRDLSAFFAQWLHGTTLVDYALGSFDRKRLPDGAWETRVEVVRRSPGWFPVTLRVEADGDTASTRVDGQGEREWVALVTRTKPKRVLVDPELGSHDWNVLNNRGAWGLLGLKQRPPETSLYFDTYVRQPARRDGRTIGLAPAIWYNDAGGLVIGARVRSDYLGRFEQNLVQYSLATGAAGELRGDEKDFRFKLGNPTWWRAPGMSQSLEVFRQEGRAGAGVTVQKTRRAHLGFGPVRTAGLSLQWVATKRFVYLDPSRWDNGGTFELTAFGGVRDTLGPWALSLSTTGAGGVMYDKEGPGLATGSRFDGQFYGRLTAEARASRMIGRNFRLAARAFGGTLIADAPVLQQRQIFLAGADPYEVIQNPFLRSRGSLLAGEDVHYHEPGGAGVRAVGSFVKAKAAVALNAELEWTAVRRAASARLARQVGVAIFWDIAWARDEPSKGPVIDNAVVADAGVGIRIDHRIGDIPFTTRVDFPIYLSHLSLAQDRAEGKNRIGFRYVIGFERPF